MTGKTLRAEREAGPEPRTQSQLAADLGVVSNTVARWERDELPIPTWVDKVIALIHRVDHLEQELARARARYDRLKTRASKK